MWPFHRHNIVLVAETYSPPQAGKLSVYTQSDVMERFAHGCTTFVWKCSDPTCITRSVLGKRQPP